MRLSPRSPKATNRAALAGVDAPLPLAVLEFQSPTAAIIATPMPAIARYTNWFIGALVISVLIASAMIPVDRLVTAPGVLQSSAADFNIQAFNATSIVESISVQPGEMVHKGQILATLNPTYTAADLMALTTQAQSYSAQVAELQAQEDGKPYFADPGNPQSTLQLQTYEQMQGQYRDTMQYYNQQISQLQTNIQGYNAQAAYYRQRLAIASNVENMRKDLQALQVGSKLDTLAATDDRVNLQAELASAVSSAASSQKQIASVTAQRDGFDQQWRAQVSQTLATALNNLTQTEDQLTKARLDNQLVVLRAPQDAIVQSIASAATGTVLQAGQELMDLAPLDAPLSIEADIDATESGYAHVGNPVTIKFATLPYMQFGDAKGTVISVSPESFNPNDQSAVNGPLLPGTPQHLFYKAQISMDVIDLRDTPPGFRLVPGMPVEADIKVGRRSVLGFFMRRMLPIAYESFHEP